jgi:hypothetical protein
MSNNHRYPKVSARPPEKRDSLIDQQDDRASSFIKEGSIEKTFFPAEKKVNLFPWENARDDVYKTFNLRLPEAYAVKLDYVAMRLNISKHSVCMSVVKKEIDKLLDDVFKSIDV